MKKRLLAMVLCLAMVASCLTGCSSSSSSSSSDTSTADSSASTSSDTSSTDASAEETDTEWFGTEDGQTITLRLWGGVQPEYGYDELVANFNEEYADKGVQVEYVRYVNDTDGNLQLETYLMGGGEIDVFLGYGGYTTMNERAEAGLLWDMSEKLEEYDFDLVEEMGEVNVYKYIYDDGSIYGFPTKYENARWMMINVDMFEEAGIDIPYDGWTYSEFLEACEKLTSGEGQDKVYGCYWNLSSLSAVKSVMGSVLGEYATYTDDTHTAVNYDNEVWQTSLEWLYTLQEEGYMIPLEDEVSESLTMQTTFLEGKSAMTTNIAYLRFAMDTETYPHDFVTAVVPAPVPDGEEYESEYYREHLQVSGAGDVISIAASCEYTDAAFEFVIWYVTGGMTPLAKGGRYPLWSGYEMQDIVDMLVEQAGDTIDQQSLLNYLNIDKTVIEIPESNETEWASSEISSVFKEEVQAMLYGQQDVDTTIDNLVTRSNKLISDAIAAAQ